MARVRPLFENSTVCLKIDAKYPVLMGHGLWELRFLWVVFRTVFPLVVRLWLFCFLPEALRRVSVLQPEINMACPMLYSERRVGFF